MSLTRRDFVRISAQSAGALGLSASLLRCATARTRTQEALVSTGPVAADVSYFEQQFGVSQAQMREVLQAGLASGGDFCELFFQHARRHSVALEDGQVNRASASVSLGLGVRVLRGDQTGYAYTERLDREAMLQAARAAAAIADGPAHVDVRAFSVDQPQDHYPTRQWWSDLSVDRRVPILQKLNELTFARDAQVSKVRASLADSDDVVLVANSLGQLFVDRQPMVVLRLSCSAQRGDAREENYDSFAARAGLEVIEPALLERLASNAVRRALINFDAKRPPAGELPVLLSAGSSGILLHEAIGHGMEADFNRKGTSVYSDQINEPIAPPFVNIVDDGTVTANRGAINVDDEGNASQKTLLVEDGVLRTYLHDRISAAHYKVAPTGSGRRQSFRHAPLPRMRTTYMLAGPHSREEMLAGVKLGVVCETFTNGQVNIGAGDFTFYCKNGHLIEDGKVTAPIKDFNIIGNGPEVLKKVTHVGGDLELDSYAWTCGKGGQSVPVGLGMPTCLVSSITVGGVDKA